MRVIEGYELAKRLLSRQPLANFEQVSLVVKQRVEDVFGAGVSPEQAVRQIIEGVRQGGDAAVLSYTLKLDRIKLSVLEVSRQQIKDACRQVDGELVSALRLAAKRIGSFHKAQKRKMWGEVKVDGLAQIIRPLERVGIYVPGGTAFYPSTVLMTAVPARVAGVSEVVLATPSGKNGTVPAPTLVAADIAGVDRVFSMGGAQAIAAMAFGTESVPRVDKICGPGNIFVVLAKKLVYGAVGVDGLQGPSEILIIADESANSEYCAADLLAQAEHDPLASAIMVTTSKRLADEVGDAVKRQMRGLKRKEIAAEALANRGLIIVVSSLEKALELANFYAPEHLHLMVAQAESYIDKVRNAGCIFVGAEATVTLGDYVAGPSHVLPTGGTARFSSPLNITDFIKFTNVISVDKTSLEKLGRAAMTIARAEGLEAHAKAVEKRLKTD